MTLVGDPIAVVDYTVDGDAVLFIRTYTAPSHRGKGYADTIVGFAVDDVEQNSRLRVIPACWYVGDWFEKHPERAGLLTRST